MSHISTFRVQDASEGASVTLTHDISEILSDAGWTNLEAQSGKPDVFLIGASAVSDAAKALDTLPTSWRSSVILVGVEGAGIGPSDRVPKPGTFAELLEKYGVAGHISARLLETPEWRPGTFVGAKRLMDRMGATAFKHSQTERYCAWVDASEADAKKFLVALATTIGGSNADHDV